MKFNITGNLSARLCGSLSESLCDVLVKIYLASPERELDDNLSKQLPSLADQETIRQKAELLVGSGQTDAMGNYDIILSANYKGGPLEIHLEVSKIPKQPVNILNTIQFEIRRLQPVWRGDIACTYSWNYRLPFAFWNMIRAIFDAWLLCGHIRVANDHKMPVAGVQVSAMDYDWFKDDFLGRCITDLNGFFRIDYTSSDFMKTLLSPVINIETPISTIPGPGVYFKIEAEDGQLLYEEERNIGNTSARRNIPRCFYTELLVLPERFSVLK